MVKLHVSVATVPDAPVNSSPPLRLFVSKLDELRARPPGSDG